MKVLIIDPHSPRQRQLRTALNALGHRSSEIESAPDIDSGLEALGKRRWDVCILAADVRAYDIASKLGEIRSNVATRSLPIIAIGAYPVKEEVVAVLRAGASAYLSYPFSAGDLEGALKLALR